MTSFAEGLSHAIELIISFDNDLIGIIAMSLKVSISAVLISCIIGFPIGASLALCKFRGRNLVLVILNSFMGLPPVVVGLIVFLLLSRSGPFGVLGLLFTPTAMIIAQTILITPIIAALTRQTIEDLWDEYSEYLKSLDSKKIDTMQTLLWDARFSLVIIVLAGFGRAIAEVGAVMIVGGNIDNITRVMTTAIALETSKGNLSIALGLGITLLFIAFAVNGVSQFISSVLSKRAML
ncbi:MAG: ABC transporter permease [Alphaproteobacteria bacterium]